jgi:hypothetical protein
MTHEEVLNSLLEKVIAGNTGMKEAELIETAEAAAKAFHAGLAAFREAVTEASQSTR